MESVTGLIAACFFHQQTYSETVRIFCGAEKSSGLDVLASSYLLLPELKFAFPWFLVLS